MDISTYNEQELILRLSQGDDSAFAGLFHLYRNKVYIIAFKLMGSASQAEEIVQDVFLKIWLKRDSLQDVTHFRAWLFTIARNHIFTSLKLLAREQGMETELRYLEPAQVNETEDAVHYRDYHQILQKAVKLLPPQQERIYKLSKEEGLKRNEIADRLKLSPETVKVHLANAMRSVRAYCLARMDLNTFFCLIWLLS